MQGHVSREEVQYRIQDCPIYKECRENWWRTHPTNSDTTTPSNPEQEKTIEEVQEGSLGIDDPPQKSSVRISQTKTKKGLEERKEKVLLKLKQTSKLKVKRNNHVYQP